MKKRGVLLVAHGSRRDEANRELFAHLERLRAYFGTTLIEAGFMELASPSIEDAVGRLIEGGAEEVVVLPFFLFRGMHTTEDVPGLVKKAVERYNPCVSVRLLEPVGAHPLVFDILREELYPELVQAPVLKELKPQMIEEESMKTIERCLEGWHIPEEVRPVVKRVIHTTGDFQYIKSLVFSPDAVRSGVDALRGGTTIYTDVTMVRSGINQRYGHSVVCMLNDEGVKELAEREGITRASASMRSLSERLNRSVVVIGNAPTALLTLLEMINHQGIRPSLVVATPVGFVNAREAKLMLETTGSVPYITNRGFKGGSTVAVAIVNALIKLAFENKNPKEVRI